MKEIRRDGEAAAGEQAELRGRAGLSGQGEPRDLVELSELEQAVLRVEREWWKVARTREAAIRELTGLSEARYYLLLSALLDQERIWRADPVLVDRLRRLRERKLAERAGKELNER